VTDISEWQPRTFFWLNLSYLGILAALLVGRGAHGLYIDRIEDPIGGLVPVAVPWFGALGAVLISLYGVFGNNDNTQWNRNLNYWHAARPVVGSLLAVIAFLVFVGLINAAGSDPRLEATAGHENVAYLVLAFLVGFREETFRTLLQRASDILLGPGTPNTTTSVVLTAPPQIPPTQANLPRAVPIIISNTGSSPVNVSDIRHAVIPNNGAVVVPQGFAPPVTVQPSSSDTVTLQVTPQAVGQFAVVVTAAGSFGTRTLTLRGEGV